MKLLIGWGLLLFGCASGFCGTVFTQPVGLAPGSQYQLAFITAGTSLATSTNIADYNSFVTAEAALNATLAAFDTANGVTWTVIGSTTMVDANVNAASTGAVYTLDGVQIASGANPLYSGSLLSALNIDQNGDVLNSGTWTGSNSSGTAAGGINDLGQTFTEFGSSSATSASWIAAGNGTFNNNGQHFYALSSVITVPAPSAVPEPASVVLTAGALLVLGSWGRRRSRWGVAGR